MFQAVVNKGHVEVLELPKPAVNETSILIKVINSCVSTGTELSNVEASGESILKKALKQPDNIKKVIDSIKTEGLIKTLEKVKGKIDELSPLGYSISGEVVEIGKYIKNFKIGDKVAAAGGGYAFHAEYVSVPENLVVNIPDGLDYISASTVALGSISLQGIRRADLKLGEICAVVGTGNLGLLAIQMLKTAGIRIIAIDVDSKRLELAKELGAETIINPSEENIEKNIGYITNGYGVDAVLFTAATTNSEPLSSAFKICKKKGKVVLVGVSGMEINREDIYSKELDFLISTSYGPGRYDTNYEEKGIDYPYSYVRWTENRNMVEYLRLVKEENVRLEKIINKIFPIEEVETAFESLKSPTDKPLMLVLSYSDRKINHSMEFNLDNKVNLKIVVNKNLINTAVIGAGNFAKAVHLPNLKKLSKLFHIRAIVSASGINAKNAADRFGADYYTTDYLEILEDKDIDLVIISTRHNLHAQQAIKAAKAGKAIFLEKPMAMNTSELLELGKAIEENKVPLMVGYNRRFSPAAIRAKEIIKKRSSPLVILYRVNAGFVPQGSWINSEEGGGRMIGEACHFFDFFNFMVGSFEIDNVSYNYISENQPNVNKDENTITSLKYKDGSICTLIYTSLGGKDLPKEYIEIYADGKTLIIEDYKELKIFGANVKGWKSNIQDKGHINELKEFASFLKGKSKLPIEFADLMSSSSISFRIL